MKKDKVYILTKPEGVMTMVYYTQYKELINEYKEIINMPDLVIQKITLEQLDQYKKDNKNIVEELVEGEDGAVASEGEWDMISTRAESEMYDFVRELKKIRKQLKCFKGKAAKNLRQAIKDFLDEPSDNSNSACDPYSVEGRLLEKIKEGYYLKTRLRKLYDDKDDVRC